ncbi:MAG: sulfatase-like hydrolase/transferase [Pseudoflavonifractor sp.]
MRENILFFFSDQQRFDTLGCNGQPLPVTPCLDRLAGEGVNFQQTFTPQPVCGPARACLQTGRYPTEIGCHRNAVALPLDIPTLARQMKAAGYEVAYVGKWHLASDEHENHYETSAVPVERRGGYDGYWRASDVLEFTSHGYDGYVFDENGKRLDFKGYRADCITDYALEFIRAYQKEKPFFLFLSHIEPHHQNDRGDYEGPEGSRERFGAFTRPADLKPGVGDWERFMPDYLGCCHALDANLGRVVEALKEKGIYDNTTILYASDHGCHFRNNTDKVEAGYDDYKRNSYENTIHVPLIIKGGAFSGGRVEQRLVSLIDLPRTILELGGAEVPAKMQGQSLLHMDAPDWKKYVYIQISESYVGRAVVWAPEKHPWNDSGSQVYEEKYLFDLARDPLEQNNLLADPGYADRKAALRNLLLEGARTAREGNLQIKEAVPC